MIYVLTIIIGGQFYQYQTDPISCRVSQAHNIAIGATYASCKEVRDVAA